MYKFLFFYFLFFMVLLSTFLVIYGSMIYVFSIIFFFCFFFELSPRPWLLQILVVGPGPGTLVIVFPHRY